MKLTQSFHTENIIGNLAWRRSICMGAPSLEQMAEKIGMSVPYVDTLLFKLERKKIIKRNAGYARSTRLLEVTCPT